MTDARTAILTAEVVALTTYRLDGRGVTTPVWAAAEDGRLYIFSNAKAGKVKRLRNSGRATLAPCTFAGKITGSAHPAEAVLLPAEQAVAELPVGGQHRHRAGGVEIIAATEIVLGAGADVRRERLAVHVDLLVPLAPPIPHGIGDHQRIAHVDALALGGQISTNVVIDVRKALERRGGDWKKDPAVLFLAGASALLKQQNEADSGPDYRDEFTVNKLYSVKNGKPIREVDPIKAIEK